MKGVIETKFIIDGSSVIEVIEIGDGLVVPANVIFEVRNHELFESRKDARYHSMIKELEKGKSIENFKSSKYYKYYLNRLRKDHPEYLI
jgi:hypothetical protein